MKPIVWIFLAVSTAAFAQSESVENKAPTDEQLSRILLNEIVVLKNCESQKFIDCMNIDVQTCSKAISESVQLENKNILKEITGKNLTDAQVSFYKGQVVGSFMVEFLSKTKTSFEKFRSCSR